MEDTIMIYEFTVEILPFGLSKQFNEQVFRLSNQIILLPSERDANGNYYGGIGLAGLYLRTETVYSPVYNNKQEIIAFLQMKPMIT